MTGGPPRREGTIALIGLSADAVEKYELEGDPDRGTDEATRFHIGTLSNRERSIIMDAASEFIAGENATAKIMPFQACYEATRKAVRVGTTSGMWAAMTSSTRPSKSAG